jgi:hypothetical protein
MLFATTATASASTQQTYFIFGGGAGTMSSGGWATTQGAYDRDFNRVYRPLGYLFQLKWHTSSGSWTLAVQGTGPNPLVDATPRSSVYEGCFNLSGAAVYPTTCQTTIP